MHTKHTMTQAYAIERDVTLPSMCRMLTTWLFVARFLLREGESTAMSSYVSSSLPHSADDGEVKIALYILLEK